MLKSRLFAVSMVVAFCLLFWGVRVVAQTAADQDMAAATTVEVPAEQPAATDNFDFFSEAPVQSAEVVELPPEKSKWITIGAPLALIAFFFLVIAFNWWTVPFTTHSVDINLRDFPPAAKRGIAFAVVIFGIAFCFGASEIWYQLRLHGSAEAYFAQMSLGKLIAFTHAHLFGFTTCFFIIGIPFSMQFNQISLYQWIFPAGLAASLTDVMSWWGIKYLTPNFEWVSMFCGIVFSMSYLWMLIGLLRVLLFPDVIWASDKDRAPRLAAKQDAREQRKHHEGDY
ncbi:MAG: hypothetical protein V4709_11460 [Pseudomonadota bacterium]